MSSDTRKRYSIEESPEKTSISSLDKGRRSRLKDRLIALCSIVAPSCSEGLVVDYIKEFITAYDTAEVSLYEFPSSSIPSGGSSADLLVEVAGSSPCSEPVILCSHLDTVPIPSEMIPHIIEEEGRIHTDGRHVLGGDDRAGVAAALEMIALGAAHPERHGGLQVLFTVQEELGCLGTKGLDTSRITAAYGYNLDGETPPGTIITRAPQKAKYHCTIHGRSAHAALAPEDGINAIKIAGMIVDKLPQGQIDDDTTANIGSIAGGKQTNIVPDTVEISGEVRSFSEERFADVRDRVEDICSSVSKGMGGSVELVWEHCYYGYTISPESMCVRRFSEACSELGMIPGLLSSPGGGDSNNLNAYGIENVVFGLGMHEIHTPHEYLILDEFYEAVEILEKILFVHPSHA